MTSPRKHRHAIVGLGSRSYMYSRAILKTYADRHELVGLCDTNQARMAWCNSKYRGWCAPADIPAYAADAFDTMVAQTRPDTVITSQPSSIARMM